MKRRLLALLLGTVLCFSIIVPATAAGNDGSLDEGVMLIAYNNNGTYIVYALSSTNYTGSSMSAIWDDQGESQLTMLPGYVEFDHKAEFTLHETGEPVVDSSSKTVKLSKDGTVIEGEQIELPMGEAGATIDLTADVYSGTDRKYLNGYENAYRWNWTGDQASTDKTITIAIDQAKTVEVTCAASIQMEGFDTDHDLLVPLGSKKLKIKITPPTPDSPADPSVNRDGTVSLSKTPPRGCETYFWILDDKGNWAGPLAATNGVLNLTAEQLTWLANSGGKYKVAYSADNGQSFGTEVEYSVDADFFVNGNKPPEAKFTSEQSKDAGGTIENVSPAMEYRMRPYRRTAAEWRNDFKTDAEKMGEVLSTKDGIWGKWPETWTPITGTKIDGIDLDGNVWAVQVRYAATATQPAGKTQYGYLEPLGTKVLTVDAKKGYVSVLGKSLGDDETLDGKTVDMPIGETIKFALVANKGCEFTKATVVRTDTNTELGEADNFVYNPKTGLGSFKAPDSNCVLTAKFRTTDSGGGDFIPGTSETSGTTGTQTATGTSVNPWLLGGMGGTTAQSGAQTVGGFSDVPKSAYYAEAVLWAVNNNITNGTSATTFSPDASCTRAQMVTFLWRQAGSPEPGTTNNPFTDVKADQYYYKAVLWAVGKGITNGTSATTFSPNATVTRAQCVTFLWRNAGKPNAGTGKTFTDVTPGPYSEAINWAAARGVTQGTSATTFSPSNPCTRAQIVTFMYRAI